MARRLRRLAAVSTAAVVLAGVGACTSDPDEAGGTTSTKGLTEDTIRIGVIGADFGQLSQIGLAPDLGNQEVTVQAFVDEINEGGGIAGRQIELRQTLIDGTGGAGRRPGRLPRDDRRLRGVRRHRRAGGAARRGPMHGGHQPDPHDRGHRASTGRCTTRPAGCCSAPAPTRR